MPFIRDLRRPVLDFLTPSYILDFNFQYVDWNAAFDEMIAKPCGLRFGMHGTMFIGKLENCEDVMKRSLQVFAAGKHPLVDTEPILYRSQNYGLIQFQKFASQIIDEKGRKSAWVLALNIVKAEKNEAQLWQDLSKWHEREVLWSIYATSIDSLLLNTPQYEASLEWMAGKIGGASRCVDFGAATGELALRLAKNSSRELWLIEINETMVEMTRKKCLGTRAKVIKEYPDRLHEFSLDSADAVFSWDGISRASDWDSALSQFHRILRPKGRLIFGFIPKGAQSKKFLEIVRKAAEATKGEDWLGQYQSLEYAVNTLGPSIAKHTQQEVEELLKKQGFSQVEWHEAFDGNLCQVAAVKS